MNWLNSPYVIALFPIVMSALLLLAKGKILRLPSWAQPIVPIVTAGVPVALAQFETGVAIGASLLAGLLAGLEAIGVYHAAGKLRGKPGQKEPRLSDEPTEEPAPPTLRGSTAALVLLALLLSGCTASFEEARLAGLQSRSPGRAMAAPPSERCMALDDEHRWWGGVAQTTAVLASAQGISTWPIDGKNAETALAIGAGVTAAVAAGSAYLSAEAGEAWVRECTP
jgi:hypothetical protein